MSRMRTLDAGFAEFKASDPNTALTKNGLREMLLAGTIPSVSCGRKRLFDLDTLEHYLANPEVHKQPTAPAVNGIRRISV